MSDDWAFGVILERRGERVMFLRWDHERRRMLGGGQAWFVGVRVTVGRTATGSVGAQGNYSAAGWRVVEEEDE